LNNKDFIFTQGIILPIFGFNPQSNMLVRIIEDECKCFNTKKRTPYQFVFETIDIQDLV